MRSSTRPATIITTPITRTNIRNKTKNDSIVNTIYWVGWVGYLVQQRSGAGSGAGGAELMNA
eukprot:1009104-Amphidinium_carterae.1